MLETGIQVANAHRRYFHSGEVGHGESQDAIDRHGPQEEAAQ
jgi:hypothetical protein